MPKTILITGATDGIGFETAKMLVQKGHYVLLHGRSSEKLEKVKEQFSKLGEVDAYIADLSNMNDVKSLAEEVLKKHKSIDILINNAGVLKTPNTKTSDNLDIRFAVNTIAPYLLTKKLLPLLNNNGRVINLSSAAQASVDINALTGQVEKIDTMEAYAQSKLALIMWSKYIAKSLKGKYPILIAVNPGSLLGSKMVKEGFGIDGKDLSVGADIISRLALEDEFEGASGNYFDNDKGRFSAPHIDALDDAKCIGVVDAIETILN